jgi:hypothetical protein
MRGSAESRSRTHVDAEHAHLAGGRLEHAEQHRQRGRLARAVAAEERVVVPARTENEMPRTASTSP